MKNSLSSFKSIDLKDSFLDAILYGLFFSLTENNKVCKDKVEEILAKEFFDRLKEKNEMLQLDQSREHLFQKCHVTNDFLEERELFLRVYEKRDKFHYIVKKGTQGKNSAISDLWSCVQQKFNGYDILKAQLKNKEKCHYKPIVVIYELLNGERSTECFLPVIYCSDKVKGLDKIYHLVTRKCYYCDKYYAYPAKKIGQHTKICSGITGNL